MKKIVLDLTQPQDKKVSAKVESFKSRPPTISTTPKNNTKTHNTKTKVEKKKKKFFLKRWSFWIPFLLVVIVFGSLYLWFTSATGKALNINPVKFIINQVTGQKEVLKSDNGKVTLLLLGVDNRSSSLTSDLKQIGNTDTIMMISLDTATNNVSFVSVPRDIGVKFKFPDRTLTTFNKINAGVNIGANQNYPGGGAQLLRDALFDMTGIKVNYTVIVNFEAFIEVIDKLGGVDINVENTFCDAGFPLPGDNGVETIRFERGMQHMDGKKALKFARSRVHNECANGTSGSPVFEGSDFRRAYRQQQVIKALQEKVSKVGADIPKIQSILSSIGNNMLTQMGDGNLRDENRIDLDTLKAVYDLKDTIKKDNQTSIVLSPAVCGGNALKVNSGPEGYYVLPMKPNDFSLLHSCIEFFSKNPIVAAEKAKVVVYNTGYGTQNADKMVEEIQTTFWTDTEYYGNITFSAKNLNTVDPATGFFVYTATAKDNTVKLIADKYKAQILTKTDLPKNFQMPQGIDVVIFTGKMGSSPTSTPIKN